MEVGKIGHRKSIDMATQSQVVKILRILYPVWVVLGTFSILYVSSTLIIEGDAATTARNIAENEFLFRLGIMGSLITQLLFVLIPLFLYKLFEPVSKTYSLFMVILALVSVPIAMGNELLNFAALQSLDDPEQMMFFLNLHTQGIGIASIFWGLWLFPLGYLVYKSEYFPRIIGIAVIFGAIGYTLGFLARLLVPNLTALLSVFEIITFGEVIFAVWLVVKGANVRTTSEN